MRKSLKKIAGFLCAILLLQPAMFAVDTELTKEIIALELEIVKMETRTGDYSKMPEKQLEKKKAKAKKDLEKKKAKAKKEAQKDTEALKKDMKKTGKDIKKAFD